MKEMTLSDPGCASAWKLILDGQYVGNVFDDVDDDEGYQIAKTLVYLWEKERKAQS